MQRRRIPCPSKAELELLLSQYSLAETAEILGSHPNTVGTWKKKLGISVKRKWATPIPEGFEEFCKEHTRSDTAEHFGLNYEMVRQMEKRTGVKCARRSCKRIKCLEDLPVLLKYFTKEEVAERIGVTNNTIYEWLKLLEKGENFE